LITALYYDKTNAFEYCAENPFQSGRASWIVNDIEQYLKDMHPNSKKLIDSLEKLKESVDVDSMKSVERKTNLWLSCQDKIEDMYDMELAMSIIKHKVSRRIQRAYEHYNILF
jgi:hypothetical protein